MNENLWLEENPNRIELNEIERNNLKDYNESTYLEVRSEVNSILPSLNITN